MLTSRTNWKLTPNQLTLRLKTLQKAGVRILDLSESNPTRCQFEYLKGELLSSLSDPQNILYEPNSKGMLEARRAVQNDYQKKGVLIDPEHIFLTASTSEAYSFLFRLLVNPGERVLVPRPSYPLFDFLADLNDVRLDSYSLRYNGSGWNLDMANLTHALQIETKAIILVHPNNPTGSFINRRELDEIIKLAQTRSLALISDEVFSDYSFSDDPERIPSLAETQEVSTFTLGGISKALGLPQMKLSWITATGPEKMLEPLLERLEMILDTYLSVSTPIQRSLPIWLQSKALIQNEIKTRIQKNRAFLLNALSHSQPANYLHADGGWYAILQIPKTKSEEEWVLEFLEKQHVYLQPGYFFDFEEEAYIVLSLLVLPNIFEEGVLRILKRIKTG